MIARRLMIRGQVQGVGYRYAMEKTAIKLGVAGWVRNRHDGTVEAHVEGNESDVLALVEWARQGPPGATVLEVTIIEVDVTNLTDFDRHPTA